MAISLMDKSFLLRCEEVKNASYDPYRQVGAVIVNKYGEIVAEGTNAPPSQLGMTRIATSAAIDQDSNWKYFMLEHAERNAIFSARDHNHSLVGATMYVTLFPCSDCARAIVSAGISRIVISSKNANSIRDQKWEEHYLYAMKILNQSGLIVELYNEIDE